MNYLKLFFLGTLFFIISSFFFKLSLIIRQLLVEPKQRKVIICENILYPIAFKKLIATILFEKYQVISFFLKKKIKEKHIV